MHPNWVKHYKMRACSVSGLHHAALGMQRHGCVCERERGNSLHAATCYYPSKQPFIMQKWKREAPDERSLSGHDVLFGPVWAADLVTDIQLLREIIRAHRVKTHTRASALSDQMDYMGLFKPFSFFKKTESIIHRVTFLPLPSSETRLIRFNQDNWYFPWFIQGTTWLIPRIWFSWFIHRNGSFNKSYL